MKSQTYKISRKESQTHLRAHSFFDLRFVVNLKSHSAQTGVFLFDGHSVTFKLSSSSILKVGGIIPFCNF
jgi:hypothetical protein